MFCFYKFIECEQKWKENILTELVIMFSLKENVRYFCEKVQNMSVRTSLTLSKLTIPAYVVQ